MAQTYTTDPYNSAHVVATDMTEINQNFAALKSAFSGATTPANTVAGQWWYDTTAHILKVRNEANSAWLSVWDLANNKPIIANLSDEITGAMISSAIKDAAAGTASLRTLGTGAAQACAGNDSRLDSELVYSAITQSMLKTSVGGVSITTSGSSGGSNLVLVSGARTLPGGTYGFYPQVCVVGAAPSFTARNITAYISYETDIASYVTNIYLSAQGTRDINYAYTLTGYAQQRYVTSSGEVHWVFILRDKITKDVVGMYQAPDHPCFGNGGKPLVVPHPFGSYDPAKHEIIVINPSDEDIFNMQDACIMPEDKPDKDILEVIMEDYEIDEDLQTEWPKKEITVELPKGIDWKRMPEGTKVTPVKKRIPKPEYITTRKLWRRK